MSWQASRACTAIQLNESDLSRNDKTLLETEVEREMTTGEEFMDGEICDCYPDRAMAGSQPPATCWQQLGPESDAFTRAVFKSDAG